MSLSAVPSIENRADGVALRRAAILQWATFGHGLVEGVAALYASQGARSVALLGFGLDSIVELASASIVLWRLASLRGVRRFYLSEENGLRLVGMGFLILAGSILMDAGQALVRHEMPQESVLGMGVAAFSVAFMPLLGRWKEVSSGEIRSDAMRADAKQTHFCAYLAGITLLGLVLNATMGWWWADPIAALVMAPIIAWEGIQALRGRACGCAACR